MPALYPEKESTTKKSSGTSLTKGRIAEAVERHVSLHGFSMEDETNISAKTTHTHMPGTLKTRIHLLFKIVKIELNLGT